VLAAAGVIATLAASVQAAPEPSAPDARPEPETIVVTGERVARSLRQTPSSVVVTDEKAIEANGANRLDQVLALVPNVQLGNGSTGPAIRGMDTTGPLYALPAFLGGNRPRTSLVVDGRAVSYNEFVFGAFPIWDVDRIEIFRSPQTTTQGQNSIAGALFINTNDPGLNHEFRFRAIAGSLKTRQVSAVVSAPISGDTGLRVAGDLRYSQTSSDIADVIEGGDPNHDVYGLLRAKLVSTPGPDTRVELTYVHSQSQAPQIVGVKAPLRERRDDNPNYGTFRVTVDSLTASLRQQVGRDLSASLTLSSGRSSARRLAIRNFGQTRNHGRDWSAEALMNWMPDGPLKIVGGISHQHLALKQFINLSLLSGAIGNFKDRQDGTGIFAEASWQLASRTTITAGLRYQRDRQERVGQLAASSFTVPVDFVGLFHAWLPKVTIAYDVTPDLRIGAMVQKAYNPGGTTIRVDTLLPDEFRAETLWDYELFARARFAQGRATATANLFYYDMRDAQRAEDISVVTPSGRRAGFANLFNVPKARTYGAEAQLDWQFSETLNARFAAGLLATKILRTDAESAHLKGNAFDRSPHFTGAAAIDWRPADRFDLSAQVRHHSSYFSDAENSSALKISSATNVDARAAYRLGKVELFAQVRNLFDAFNMLDLDSPTSGEAEDPRSFAIGLQARL
jgi:outer membrane receptor protein involved in Fe transport